MISRNGETTMYIRIKYQRITADDLGDDADENLASACNEHLEGWMVEQIDTLGIKENVGRVTQTDGAVTDGGVSVTVTIGTNSNGFPIFDSETEDAITDALSGLNSETVYAMILDQVLENE